jgi:hypothetical protein
MAQDAHIVSNIVYRNGGYHVLLDVGGALRPMRDIQIGRGAPGSRANP